MDERAVAGAEGAGRARFVIVAPTFNNAGTVGGVLRAASALGVPVIAVNDGSTDRTDEALAAWETEINSDGRAAARAVRRHTFNRGKAAALGTGFETARAMGFTHAATIDTDGQHDPADLVGLMRAANAAPAALVLGARPVVGGEYPWRSRFGRSFSNWTVRVESGVRVLDSQSGMRVYPLDRVREISCAFGRYGFETEVLTRAVWAGIPLIEVPIRCIYTVPGGRVTHFRAVRDSASAVGMHARLIAESLLRRCRGASTLAPAPRASAT